MGILCESRSEQILLKSFHSPHNSKVAFSINGSTLSMVAFNAAAWCVSQKGHGEFQSHGSLQGLDPLDPLDPLELLGPLELMSSEEPGDFRGAESHVTQLVSVWSSSGCQCSREQTNRRLILT